MNNENTHIVYRNRFEKDADEFWHSETGTTLILVFVGVLLLSVVGLVIYNRKRGY